MQNKTETKKTKGAATQLPRMAMKLQFPLFLLKGPSFRKHHKLARGPLRKVLKTQNASL